MSTTVIFRRRLILEPRPSLGNSITTNYSDVMSSLIGVVLLATRRCLGFRV